MSDTTNQNLRGKLNNVRHDAYHDLSDRVMELCAEFNVPEQDSIAILQSVFSNFEIDNDYGNSILSTEIKNIIPVPDMLYWDAAKTKPKKEIDVWDNGSLRYSVPMNESGNIYGLKESWYNNGQRYGMEYYKDGEHHGTSNFWHENTTKDVLRCSTHYKNGELHGLTTLYYENGEKILDRNFVDGKKHGLETHWHENGMLQQYGNYKNDKKDGEWKFFKNGELAKTDTWVNGKLKFSCNADDYKNPVNVVDDDMQP